MPLNVAQLAITVSADTSTAIDNMEKLNATFGISQEAASAMVEQVTQALAQIAQGASAAGGGEVVQAITAGFKGLAEAITEAGPQIAETTTKVSEGFGTMAANMRDLEGVPLPEFLENMVREAQ